MVVYDMVDVEAETIIIMQVFKCNEGYQGVQ